MDGIFLFHQNTVKVEKSSTPKLENNKTESKLTTVFSIKII